MRVFGFSAGIRRIKKKSILKCLNLDFLRTYAENLRMTITFLCLTHMRVFGFLRIFADFPNIRTKITNFGVFADVRRTYPCSYYDFAYTRTKSACGISAYMRTNYPLQQ